MADPLFLLDSNICIYVLEGMGDVVRRRIEAHAPGEVVTSSIVYAEVFRGIDPGDQEKLARAERLFDAIPVQPFDRAAAARCRDVPFRRARFDGLIAAHVLALDLTLVTNNEADFISVPGLRIENWTKPA